MKKRFTQSVKNGAALVCAALLLAVCAGGLKAQNPWPDYDFKAANADGDTLYYRITSATAPYTVAVTRCHDSATFDLQLPLNDYDYQIEVPGTVTYNGIPYAVTAVDEKAFYLQKGIRDVQLPASIAAIGSYAFAYSNIVSIDVPGAVSILKTGTFEGCDSLASLTLNEGLLEIEENIFSSNRIQTLTFPASLRKFRPLTSGTLPCKRIVFQSDSLHPNDTLYLSPSCFRGLSQQLQQVVFSDNIFQLPDGCFSGFHSWVGTVVLPARLTEIPYRCFYEGTLYDIQFPENLETISDQAFMNAFINQPVFTIPASTTHIGSKAFHGGYPVILTLECEQPPTLGSQAFNTNRQLEFTVPCGSLSLYLTAPGWSEMVTNPRVSMGEGSGCVGVDDYEQGTLKVWPNPVEVAVNVQCTMYNVQFGMRTVEVFDVYGKLVHTENVTDNPARVNLSDLRAGVYILRVTDADGHEYHQKIVKK